jgi:precorrin-2 dehydrogenase/sirohydrochlorin ferrochelatase
MALLPVFLKISGKPVLVVGAGQIAVPKIAALLELDARICVVAPQAKPEVETWASDGRIQWQQQPYEQRDVNGNVIVYAATGIREIDRRVAQHARLHGVLCNAIDDPSFCDFYTPAMVRRGDLQIAISTNGQSPALAQQIRQQLERQFDSSCDSRIADLGERRRQLLASMPAGPERNQVLHQLAQEVLDGMTCRTVWYRTRKRVVQWLKEGDDQVWLT